MPESIINKQNNFFSPHRKKAFYHMGQKKGIDV